MAIKRKWYPNVPGQYADIDDVALTITVAGSVDPKDVGMSVDYRAKFAKNAADFDEFSDVDPRDDTK